MKKKTLLLDARNGGFGDVWMRLAGLHAAAALLPELRIEAAFAPEITPLARVAFAGRIDYVEMEGEAPPAAWVYVNRGFRELLPGVLRGRRYVAPLHRVVSSLSRRGPVKEAINRLAFSLLDAAGRVSIAPADDTGRYFGRLETSAVPALRAIPPGELLRQIVADFSGVRERLRQLPATLPPGEPGRTLVFPSGKGHQYMPVAWAAAHLPEADFAFHAADRGGADFGARGLRVVRFARPEEILFLARGRRRVVTTDSFPSHLLQYGCDDGVLALLLTLTRPESVVTPAFPGTVFPSSAPCCPCPHRERGLFPLCAEGHPACLTWGDAERSRRIESFARLA